MPKVKAEGKAMIGGIRLSKIPKRESM